MKKLLAISSLMLVIFLTGCGAAATISNVSVPGLAKDPQTSTTGQNTSLRYFSDASIQDACAAQVKLLADAKWTEVDPMENKGSYLKTSYTDGKAGMVLLCSETEVSATEKATKVTLTLRPSGL